MPHTPPYELSGKRVLVAGHRGMVGSALVRRLASAHPDLHGRNFIHARQENFETIHRHNVIAERSGELSEVLAELETGEHSKRHMTMREWLDAAGDA